MFGDVGGVWEMWEVFGGCWEFLGDVGGVSGMWEVFG